VILVGAARAGLVWANGKLLSSNLWRHRRWQIGFFALFFVSLVDVKVSRNKWGFLFVGTIVRLVLIDIFFGWIHAIYSHSRAVPDATIKSAALLDAYIRVMGVVRIRGDHDGRRV
jgi:hypothetical protein